MTIQVTRSSTANYTPRDLMLQYARENPTEIIPDYGCVQYLLIGGRRYAYDHWEIVNTAPGMDTITLHLVQVL